MSMIKSRRMRWAGHVARVGDRTGSYRILMEKHEGMGQLGKLGIDECMILKWILK
jgi:hypothetical protein